MFFKTLNLLKTLDWSCSLWLIVDVLADLFRIMINEKTSFANVRLYLLTCAYEVTLKVNNLRLKKSD